MARRRRRPLRTADAAGSKGCPKKRSGRPLPRLPRRLRESEEERNRLESSGKSEGRRHRDPRRPDVQGRRSTPEAEAPPDLDTHRIGSQRLGRLHPGAAPAPATWRRPRPREIRRRSRTSGRAGGASRNHGSARGKASPGRVRAPCRWPYRQPRRQTAEGVTVSLARGQYASGHPFPLRLRQG
jgi:hypothetical protein